MGVELPEYLGSRLIYDGWAKVQLDTLRSRRTGKQNDFISVTVDPGVAVLALTDQDEAVLVEQYRNPLKKVQLEPPGGGIKPTERLEDAAARELQEETGYRAGELTYLGMLHPAGGILNIPLHAFLARKLTKGEQKLDDLEEVTVRLVPYQQLRQELRENKHTEISLYALLALYELKKQP
jgi:ADP-ribose pyrophosphatase